MKITLINVSGRMSSDGSRLISALLKRANHELKTVFLARPEPLAYQEKELEELDAVLKVSELVLVAVYSSYAIRAVQVSDYIHRRYPGMKVIWGGPHCVSAPEISLRHADGVCFSEGEQAVIEFVNRIETGSDYLNTPNMAFKMNGREIVNEVLPPFTDLDSLPYYDYEEEDQFLLDGELFQMNKEILMERLAGYPYYFPILYIVTSRGCPHNCAYCNNCRYISMFGHNSMRFQSVDRAIKELKHTLENLDFIRFVGIGDDDFFMRSKEQIEEFACKYKKEIGLPFGIAISANTYNKAKLEILLEAGLRAVQIGVQSGSQRVLNDVYKRKVKVSKTSEVIRGIETYNQSYGLDLFVDFIIDNPYENRKDIIETFYYLLGLPDFARINIFFLAFFPGTPIYERALTDGIIGPYREDAFRFFTRSRLRYQKNYETFLILLVRFLKRHPRLKRNIPISILRAMGCSPVRRLARLLPESFYAYVSHLVQ